jgi:GxxExxY protein
MAKSLICTHASHIWKELGPGLSERMYHNAMEVCLRKSFLAYETERIMTVNFDGHVLGNLRADLIVDRNIVVELKSVKALKDEHRTQVRLYLKLLGLTDAILINFPCGLAIEPEIEFVTSVN